MDVNKSLCILSALGFLLLTHIVAAQEFSNASFSGCYVFSLSGNVLGPEITVDPETGQLVPNFQKLFLYGYSAVGRVCADGNGAIIESRGTQNLAGLCVFPFVAMDDGTGKTGTYNIDPDGLGNATASVAIPADAVLPAGCGGLGVNPGETQTFTFSFALEGEQACVKSITTSASSSTGLVPIVSTGELCPQVQPQAPPQ